MNDYRSESLSEAAVSEIAYKFVQSIFSMPTHDSTARLACLLKSMSYQEQVRCVYILSSFTALKDCKTAVDRE